MGRAEHERPGWGTRPDWLPHRIPITPGGDRWSGAFGEFFLAFVRAHERLRRRVALAVSAVAWPHLVDIRQAIP